eukprot:1145277-Pelagomonas_calceolata.AAC.1
MMLRHCYGCVTFSAWHKACHTDGEEERWHLGLSEQEGPEDPPSGYENLVRTATTYYSAAEGAQEARTSSAEEAPGLEF